MFESNREIVSDSHEPPKDAWIRSTQVQGRRRLRSLRLSEVQTTVEGAYQATLWASTLQTLRRRFIRSEFTSTVPAGQLQSNLAKR